MGTLLGVQKIAAGRIGVSLDEFLTRRSSGEKWCTGCRAWRSAGDFNRDSARGDGLSAKCQTCTRVKVRVDTRGQPSPMKGKHFSDQARANMKAAARGKPSPMDGRRHTLESRAKMSRSLRASPLVKRGAAARTFADGKAAERFGLRATPEYKAWRRSVYERDNFTCQDGPAECTRRLHAHHRLPFSTHEEGRFDIANGVTLCEGHHKARHRSGNL